ncbi:tripartite motif-containing protein 14 [Myripristis murdjan]|uniref:Si:dkey-29p10.4 n=1 Tax=Myripristis murdjan TaxID=586833 RepID=A0A667ZJE3_9TELE|nr:tripartite motif-containing protein 14-like [Myripristis murdjan]
MGASLDTPAACPLCHELMRDAVTLKCNHRFCQRCIGDLWSVSPNGPYHCPEFRCKTVYKTLPFEGIGTQPSPPSQRAHLHSTAGTSSRDEVGTSGWNLRRPSLPNRFLGKRKASAPVSEQPVTKRPTVKSPAHTDPGPSTTFPSDQPSQSANAEASKKAEIPESVQPDDVDCISSTDSSGSDVATTSDVPEDISIPQNKPGSQHTLTSDDSEGSSEVDTCDAPACVTPRKATQVTESHESSKTHASTASSNHSPGVTTPGKEKSPLYRGSWPPRMFAKNAAATSASPKRGGIFTRPESTSNGPVVCHYCPTTGQQSAVKTCLVCGASMCAEHLRPHLDSPVFQNHTLVAPMEDISLWRCQEHQEMNRIYCQQCAVCVCTVCTVIGSHRDHTCVSIREAEKELRGNLKEEIKQLQETEQVLMITLAELTQKKQDFQVVLSEARAGVHQQYGAMREALEQEEQSALQCVVQEESRALGSLEERLRYLQSSLISIQQGLHTLEGLADAKGDKRVQDQAFIMEYSKISQMVSNLGSSEEELEAPEEVDQARLKYLQKWTEKRLDTVVISLPDRGPYSLLHGTIPSLDADTAHPKLLLSLNNKRVTYSDLQQAYPEHVARFTSFPQVLASRALEGGRWYWEVEVSSDEGRWKVGLCEGQMGRKGQKDNCRLGFNPQSWCLGSEKKKVEAMHDKVAVPVAVEGLQRVGVFLDFDEGILSFFNVTPGGSLALLHSYKHSFREPLYPALYVFKTQLTISELFQ